MTNTKTLTNTLTLLLCFATFLSCGSTSTKSNGTTTSSTGTSTTTSGTSTTTSTGTSTTGTTTTGGTNTGGTTTGGTSSGGASGTGNTGAGGTGSANTSGSYVYAVSGSTLSGFRFSPSGSSLTLLAALTSAAPLNSVQLDAAPNGQFLYSFQNTCTGTSCSKAYDNVLFVQQVSSDGTLQAPKQLIGSDQQPIQVLLSGDNKWAFVLSGPNTNKVSIYPVESDGSFGIQTGSVALPFRAPNPIFGGATYTTLIGFTNTGGNYLWITQNDVDRSGNIPKLISLKYDVSSGAVLATKTTDFSAIAELETAAIVGNTLVVAEAGMFPNISPGLTTAQLSSDGLAVAQQHCTSANCLPISPVIAHPTKRFVFAGRQTTANSVEIEAFAVGTDGSLTQVGNSLPYTAIPYVHFAIDSTGGYLFVSLQGDSKLTALAIDQTTGALSEATTASVTSPGAVATSTR